MELYQLEYFRTLCRCRGYTKTAQTFGVTQPAVTTALKKLERECGVPLLDRRARHFTLTPFGASFLEHAERIHSEMADIRAEIDRYARGGRETIQLGLPLTMCPGLLFALSSQYIPNHPEVSILCSQTGPELVVDGLLDGQDQIGVSCADLCTPELELRPFGRVEFCVFFSAEHTFNHYDCITPEMLADQALLLPQSPTGVTKSIQAYFTRHRITPNYLAVGNLVPHDGYALAKAGKGVAILPRHISDQYRASLCPPLFVDLGIMWRNARELSKNQKKLIRFLLEQQP